MRDTVLEHRLRLLDQGLRRRVLRRRGLDRPAEPRHRPGRRHRLREPHRRRRPARQAGRRRPGPDVRLRLRGHPRADAAADLPRAPALRAADRSAQGRRGRLPAPRRQDPGHHRVRRRRGRSASTPWCCPPSTPRTSRSTACSTPDIEQHVIQPGPGGAAPTTAPTSTSRGYRSLINPTGSFEIGGPMGDAGLTGRKIIVDTYGGMARHGGGAFSGKDPSKVDRSAAYAMRWVAKNVVAAGLARRCEVQVAYAIGKAQPVGLYVETFGTETVPVDKIQAAIATVFDLRPRRIVEDARPAAPDLQADRGLRPLRPHPRRRRRERASPGSAPTASRRCRGRSRTDPPVPQREPACRLAVVGWAPRAPDMTGRAETQAGEQLELIRSAPAPRPRRAASPEATASTDPVASVQVDTGLAHLDRPFEYPVPAVAGRDGRSRASGSRCASPARTSTASSLERRAAAEHEGRLAPLRRVVSPEPVLTPRCSRRPGPSPQRYAGSLGDVLRLAVPPRHAAAEKALRRARPPEPPDPLPGAGGPGRAPGARYPARAGVPARTSPRAARPPRPGWPLPTTDPAERLAGGAGRGGRAPRSTAGRGSVLVVPDHRDVARVDAALAAALGPGRHVRLTADQGPQARYTAWLKVLRGHVQVVVGTRAAAFAPVRDLGLVAWWDDGDDLLDEPRAPYPHVREVLAARARLEGARAALGRVHPHDARCRPRVDAGDLKPIAAPPRAVRAAAPRVLVAGEGAELERDPAAAAPTCPPSPGAPPRTPWSTGPVLVQVPRRGYLPSLSCQTCRAPARCAPLQRPAGAAGAGRGPPACRWCGRAVARLRVPPAAAARRLRSSVVGARRTAEELGRAFPGVPVHTSGAGDGARAASPRRPAWSSPPRAPSRWPTAGMPRCCCSTPGPASTAPCSPPARSPCAAGWPPRRSAAAPATAVSSCWPARPRTRRSPRSRPWCAGTRPGSPSASSRSGASCGCPRPCGWRR